MRDYLLFIDTETSGLPKNWNAPYAAKKSWPFAVQISWIIYSKEGQLIKTEDHYIRNSDFEIQSSSQKIHGISRNFLVTNGENRKDVMAKLANDLIQYEPMVLGHFMKLDYHITGVEFFRTGLQNPIEHLPLFCTMLATTHLVENPHRKYMRLGDLYQYLFEHSMEEHHDALEDAQATADCFFELQKRGMIREEKILAQQKLIKNKSSKAGEAYKWLPAFIILLIFLILFIIWKTDTSF